MSRSFLIMVCALLTLLGAGASDARRAVKAAPQVKAATPAAKIKPAVSPATKRTMHRNAQLQTRKPVAAKPVVDKSVVKHGAVVATARPMPRFRVKDALSRLPNGERRQMLALIASPRTQGSMPVRRAVAAFLFLRGLKGGARLPISVADMQQMSGSKRWSAKRMANLATVLRTAVGIAQAEGLSANAAFQKALKQHGIQKKFNRGVCGA